MRVLPKISLLGFLTLLSACASPAPEAGSPNLTAQIANLERTEAQLRTQYNSIGDTITRLESRIADLKTRAAQQRAMVAELPKPTATGPATPAPAVPEIKPTDIAPPPSEVGSLTDADMADPAMPATAPATPAAAVAEPAKPAEPAPAGRFSYVVHLASYVDTAPIRHGWTQLSAKYGDKLEGLKPYLTPFNDAQGRKWLRLSAGPLADANSARQRCDAIKQMGDWCEVLRVSTNSMRALR